MNVPSWFMDWAIAHMDAFGLGSNTKSIEQFASWGHVWCALYTEAELRHATKTLICDRRVDKEGRSILRWAEEHRTAIPAAIAQDRQQKRRRPTVTESHSCPTCRSTGYAIVPHPGKDDYGMLNAWITDEPYSTNQYGHPIYLELSVVCSCAKGDEILHACESGDRKKPLSLKQYDEQYPEWRTVDEKIRSLRSRLSDANHADVDELKRSLAERFAMPRRNQSQAANKRFAVNSRG